MSMLKDRLRSVGVSKLRFSPPRPVLTTARVGPYGILYTIYIRPYGTRDTTLIPWIFKKPPFHRVTGSQDHQTPDPQAHHLHPGTPWAYWLTICTLAPGTLTLHWLTISPAPRSWILPLAHLQTSKTPACPRALKL